MALNRFIVVFENSRCFFKKIEVLEVFEFMGYSLAVHKDQQQKDEFVVTELRSGAITSRKNGEKPKKRTKAQAVKFAKENISNYLEKNGRDKLDELIEKFRQKAEPRGLKYIDLIKYKIL